MTFTPRVIHDDEALPLQTFGDKEADLVLPEELAALAAQLTQDAHALAERYPATSSGSVGTSPLPRDTAAPLGEQQEGPPYVGRTHWLGAPRWRFWQSPVLLARRPHGYRLALPRTTRTRPTRSRRRKTPLRTRLSPCKTSFFARLSKKRYQAKMSRPTNWRLHRPPSCTT